MRFTFLSLFPDLITPYVSTSIIGRAVNQGVVSVRTVNPRDFTTDPHRRVDDSPYGGGAGMVMTCQPVDDAFASLQPLQTPYTVVLTSPAGKPFNHALALDWATTQQELVFLCGHYEGFDARIPQILPNVVEVSLGDYVLTGGELPALAMMDAVTRLLPGAVQKWDSVAQDSFFNGLLDYPEYTRPADYKGHQVPDVLLGGNHAAINAWRAEQSRQKTQSTRPDLLPP
jgi:tRNA (guanine37-N1)-methyltransferase